LSSRVERRIWFLIREEILHCLPDYVIQAGVQDDKIIPNEAASFLYCQNLMFRFWDTPVKVNPAKRIVFLYLQLVNGVLNIYKNANSQSTPS